MATYDYNENGLRTEANLADGTKRQYYYDGDRPDYVKFFNASGVLTCTLHYIYNSSGQAEYIQYLTADNAKNPNAFYLYYIVRDNTGVIQKLICVRKPNSAHTGVTATLFVAAEYTYDPFGKLLSTTTYKSHSVGEANPLRYKDYVYDTETGWYYLQSRYYDPEIGRFINADGAYDTNQGVLGYNMYAYCLNNPVNMYDPDGRCSRFLGFLWKIDCKQASCPESKNYVKPKAVDPIGSYNEGQGYVYIVKEDLLDEIMEDKEDNVVVVLDNRTAKDPDMQIQDSYRITKTKQQKEIAQLMLNYNTANPVSPAWNRTLDSLVKEWKIHNNVYKTGLFQSNTADCNFNNGDEGKGYWDFFVERALK